MSDDNVEFTVPFYKTVTERLRSSPEFREGMPAVIVQLIHNGDYAAASILLGDIIEADKEAVEMTDKSGFIKTGLSYNKFVEELKEKFNLSDWSARQIIAVVSNWLEEEEG